MRDFVRGGRVEQWISIGVVGYINGATVYPPPPHACSSMAAVINNSVMSGWRWVCWSVCLMGGCLVFDEVFYGCWWLCICVHWKRSKYTHCSAVFAWSGWHVLSCFERVSWYLDNVNVRICFFQQVYNDSWVSDLCMNLSLWRDVML